jgi:hypothetical protein
MRCPVAGRDSALRAVRATLIRLAGRRRDPPSPSGGETSAIRCGSSYRTCGSSGSSSSPSGSRPRVSSTSGGSPRNVPIGTPPFTSGGDSNGRREEREPATPRQRRPSRRTGTGHPPGSAGRREGADTGHPQAAPAVARERIPATPNGAECDLGAAVSAVPSGTTTGVAGRQSSGAGAASVREASETGQGARAWHR